MTKILISTRVFGCLPVALFLWGCAKPATPPVVMPATNPTAAPANANAVDASVPPEVATSNTEFANDKLAPDMVLGLTEKFLGEKYPDAKPIALADPEISATDDGSYAVSGAFTADGLSHRFTCRIAPQDTGGKRQWQVVELKLGDK